LFYEGLCLVWEDEGRREGGRGRKRGVVEKEVVVWSMKAGGDFFKGHSAFEEFKYG